MGVAPSTSQTRGLLVFPQTRTLGAPNMQTNKPAFKSTSLKIPVTVVSSSNSTKIAYQNNTNPASITNPPKANSALNNTNPTSFTNPPKSVSVTTLKPTMPLQISTLTATQSSNTNKESAQTINPTSINSANSTNNVSSTPKIVMGAATMSGNVTPPLETIQGTTKIENIEKSKDTVIVDLKSPVIVDVKN